MLLGCTKGLHCVALAGIDLTGFCLYLPCAGIKGTGTTPGSVTMTLFSLGFCLLLCLNTIWVQRHSSPLSICP